MTIGVFFGSRSPEHDISIITGQLIISGLRDLGFKVVPVYLSKKGEWLLGEELGTLKTFTDPLVKIDPKKFGKYYLDLEESTPSSSPPYHGGEREGRLVFKKKGIFGKSLTIDLAFPAFHGSYGEDGTIQGLFEMFNMPYVGCGVAASAMAMDKILTKQYYEANQIPTPKFLYFDRNEWEEDKSLILEEIKTKLRWPVFVKPARLGSSIGMGKVKDSEKLEFAIEVALHFGERFLAEEAVEELMDVTCCLLGNEHPRPSLLQESVFSDEFFSYEEKYLKEGGAQLGKAHSKIIIPARLDDQKTAAIQAMAVKIFKLFGCSGIARVDFLYNKKTKKFYANEVNTLPGTLYHHLWKKSGLVLPELLKLLLDLSQERHARAQKITSTFESDLLKQTRSAKLGGLKRDRG